MLLYAQICAWRPEYYPEIDTYVETIRNATKGFGTDEKELIQTLGSKDVHERT